ncbi:ABC transporter permease [Enterovirga rhinocerotis]|uniref:Amino acid/amide ABC transporter membrane protein 1 (HAAT family) /amino acid/amide ABC transporter membrane protein 2 (HAAT family) n=1 Tax=Enterovirga rhinocerotis TaxID=1339210 RepID=A0A4R7C730_9HYPH|nr:ABC transporter permease [Enterovirga rhinocerotis]TDR94414.1 amino acid/amide ABC transporter membrane protein 1 (HAAT family) /amino acid/amide ABC transporter membrane protein 2 (HAAT family) [Enterovirga rhinocerotis]
MDFYFSQFLTGLAGAASLFLVASGLSIIFGVTRIVNFAHGAFYMAGAYIAWSLTERLEGAVGFWGGLVIAAIAVAALGALVEIVLLRRIYHAPELFQLLATFGVTLVFQDLAVMIWGPEDLVGRRAPGLRGAVDVFGQAIPAYDLFLIVLGPTVLGLLWLLFHKTRFGVLVRAATQDRDMVAALGVNQKWLFTAVFALGVFLAALGGALQLPRGGVNHAMDLQIIVEVFVVVVVGGLGSVPGAFVAALLVSELNAFGILVLPQVSLVLVFLVMAVVLVIRPFGLFGRPEGPARASVSATVRPWQPLGTSGRVLAVAAIAAAACLPLVAGNYILAVGSELLIFALFAASLQFIMSTGGLVSFGHAAYFGLGAYGAALVTKAFGLPMLGGIASGVALASIGAVVFGWFCVRLTGVYLAMLTLAFAQIAWSVAFQWTAVTGGDNGILGVWPDGWASRPGAFYWLCLTAAALGIAALRVVVFSPFGFAMRALRDSPLRSEAIGIDRKRTQWTAFVIAGAAAGLAGALFAYLKGSVFPDTLGIPTSVDGLVMVLLGGVETVSGAVIGAILFRALTIFLMSYTDASKLVLGLLIIVLVVAFPRGVVGTLSGLLARLGARPSATPAMAGSGQARGGTP